MGSAGSDGADGDRQQGKKLRTDQSEEPMEVEQPLREDPKKGNEQEAAGNTGSARGEASKKRRAAQESAKRLKENSAPERLAKSELVEVKEEPVCESEAAALQETGGHGGALKHRSVPLHSLLPSATFLHDPAAFTRSMLRSAAFKLCFLKIDGYVPNT
jgi:hypothetical protein